MARRIGKADFADKVLKADKPVLVEFYSDSCIPCKQLSPVLGDIEDDFEDTLSVYKVNTGYEDEIVEQYEIMSTPTLILFKGGEEAGRRTGFVKKDELVGWFEELIANN
jgi:thioredoxin 1